MFRQRQSVGTFGYELFDGYYTRESICSLNKPNVHLIAHHICSPDLWAPPLISVPHQFDISPILTLI